jgi:DNA-binding transcriptional ArsR family regulator
MSAGTPQKEQQRRRPTETIEERLRLELEELVAEMCKALNEPKRLMVLYALAERPRSVGELATFLEAPQSNTSQHLAVLRDRGLVDVQRQGNRVIYSLRYPKVIQAIDLLREVLNEEIGRQHQLRSA